MKGFVPALGTPFGADGKFLKESFMKQIDDQIKAGAAGILAMGSMGTQAMITVEDYPKVAAAAVEAAAANMTAEIPACMVEEQLDKHVEQFAYQLQMSGMSMDDYAKMVGGDMNGMRASMRPMAETTVRSNVLLSAVVDAEGITVSDEELEEEYAKVAEQYQMEVDQVKAALNAETVKADLASRKAVKLIVDSAVAVAPKAE